MASSWQAVGKQLTDSRQAIGQQSIQVVEVSSRPAISAGRWQTVAASNRQAVQASSSDRKDPECGSQGLGRTRSVSFESHRPKQCTCGRGAQFRQCNFRTHQTNPAMADDHKSGPTKPTLQWRTITKAEDTCWIAQSHRTLRLHAMHAASHP